MNLPRTNRSTGAADDGDETQHQPDVVTLVVPPRAAMARVARLTASSLASLGDMTIDDIDDIKIAVSEMMTMLIQHDNASEITMRFEPGADSFSIEATMAVAGPELEPPEAMLARAVLEAVCDSYELITVDGRLVVRVAKSRSGEHAHSNG